MSDKIHYRETTYGFEYGAIKVERLASVPSGHVVLSVRTGHREIHITASPKGRRLTAQVVTPLPEEAHND